MSSVTEKKDEIDLIRASFTSEEIVFDDPLLIEEFDFLESQNLPFEDKDVHLTLRIAFPEVRFFLKCNRKKIDLVTLHGCIS